jgi:hypothetical protein
MATRIDSEIKVTRPGEELPPEVYDALMAEQLEWAEDIGPEAARRLFQREHARLVADGGLT